MLQLYNGVVDTSVPVDKMVDGDVAIITAWTKPNPEYVGRIVQRFSDTLLTLGGVKDNSWDVIFNASQLYLLDCRVRILQKGETIIVG
jgi:hypothetical protein